MKFFTHLFLSFFCLLSHCLWAQQEVRDNATGATFPSEVTFEYDGKEFYLMATGVATRKKFFIKVYSIVHYLEKGVEGAGNDIFQEIMRDDIAKQLTLKWVRDVPAQRVQEGYHESFQAALSGNELDQLHNDINRYIQLFNQNVQKGDIHVLRWLPGGIIEVFINGNRVGNISGQDFARGLWSIWLGNKSVVNRNNLVSKYTSFMR